MVEKNWEKRQVQARSRAFFDMATNFSSRAEVSIFGLKDWILDTYQRLSVEKEKNRRLDHRDLEIHGSLRGGVRNLTHAVGYILVATKYRQDITLATLELLRFASGGIIYNLHGMYEACKDYLGELDTVKAYYDFIDPDINRSSTSRIPPFADYSEPTGHGMKITGKNVTFAYPSEKPVLKGLNFTIEPGECVAIIGGNGSGKSTLIKLFQRLYDVTSGSLEINSIDIRHYDPDEIWSHWPSSARILVLLSRFSF
jgi:ABC-type multidrug transport system fused ATPase/permease subunit